MNIKDKIEILNDNNLNIKTFEIRKVNNYSKVMIEGKFTLCTNYNKKISISDGINIAFDILDIHMNSLNSAYTKKKFYIKHQKYFLLL